MKIGITYGTFDLFHRGHERILQRAREQVDYLIVGVTTDHYDKSRGKLNVHDAIEKRKKNVGESGYADFVIEEDYIGQKIEDIKKYKVDKFIIGDDWRGEFDYLDSYCEVIYLERTADISSTKIRSQNNTIIELGIIGTGRIANRFVKEAKYVSGVTVKSVLSSSVDRAESFKASYELLSAHTDLKKFLDQVDAVYVATNHAKHFEFAKAALCAGKHVLVEKPICLSAEQVIELNALSKQHQCVLLEAIKTAYCPSFIKLIDIASSGIIGEVIDVNASFTSLRGDESAREMQQLHFGGALNEFASYTLLPIIKLLGRPMSVEPDIRMAGEIDGYTKINMRFPGDRFATSISGLTGKTEGDLRITGTKGYIYVEAPWWQTRKFELRFEDQSRNQQFSYNFEGDGLRYELSEFVKCINKVPTVSSLTINESLQITEVMDKVRVAMAKKNHK